MIFNNKKAILFIILFVSKLNINLLSNTRAVSPELAGQIRTIADDFASHLLNVPQDVSSMPDYNPFSLTRHQVSKWITIGKQGQFKSHNVQMRYVNQEIRLTDELKPFHKYWAKNIAQEKLGVVLLDTETQGLFTPPQAGVDVNAPQISELAFQIFALRGKRIFNQICFLKFDSSKPTNLIDLSCFCRLFEKLISKYEVSAYNAQFDLRVITARLLEIANFVVPRYITGDIHHDFLLEPLFNYYLKPVSWDRKGNELCQLYGPDGEVSTTYRCGLSFSRRVSKRCKSQTPQSPQRGEKRYLPKRRPLSAIPRLPTAISPFSGSGGRSHTPPPINPHDQKDMTSSDPAQIYLHVVPSLAVATQQLVIPATEPCGSNWL